MVYVVPEDHRGDLLRGGYEAGDLGEYVYAVGFFVHHPLHAPYLALYPLQAVLQLVFVIRFYVSVQWSPP